MFTAQGTRRGTPGQLSGGAVEVLVAKIFGAVDSEFLSNSNKQALLTRVGEFAGGVALL